MNLYIDIGSTKIKWSRGSESPLSVLFPRENSLMPPYFEVSIEKIWETVYGIINESAAARLFISVQMHGYVLLGRDGTPVTEYISWLDRRAELLSISFSVPAENGVAFKGNLPRAGLCAIRSLTPELYEKAHEFCTLGSYLAYKLTGRNATHITDAAATGFYNINTCTGISDGLKLPDASRRVEVVGNAKNGMAIYTPVGDQQAAVLGSGADENVYIMNLGTAGQLCCISSQFVTGEYESRPFFDGRTLCTVTNLPAGRAMEAHRGDWRELFYAAYAAALEKLPSKKRIVVTGGTGGYHSGELRAILDRLGLPYEISLRENALEGLKVLANQAIAEEGGNICVKRV